MTHSVTNNLLIHGDNLEVLRAMPALQGQVRCVCIDPPYNTKKNVSSQYKDFRKDWLSWMEERLRLMWDTLREDGSIWIFIDDAEIHRLRVLCNVLFGEPSYLTTIIWEKRTTVESRTTFSCNHDYILVYAKSPKLFKKSKSNLPITEEIRKRYKNPDSDQRGPWQSVSLCVQGARTHPDQLYVIVSPITGKEFYPPAMLCWRYCKDRMTQEISSGNVWFGKTGNNVPRLKKFLSESKGVNPSTIWRASDVGTTADSTTHMKSLLGTSVIDHAPKPERLVSRILHIATNPGDLVLDAFLGTGTTTAVAHKMGRRWLGIEKGEHCMTGCVPRLELVVSGKDPGGITDELGWAGGGSFQVRVHGEG